MKKLLDTCSGIAEGLEMRAAAERVELEVFAEVIGAEDTET